MQTLNLRPYSNYDCIKMIEWCYATFGPNDSNKWHLEGLRTLKLSDNYYLMFKIAWGHILRD